MIKVEYEIRMRIPGDEEWTREGSFEVSEEPQKQSGDVAEALWHGKPANHNESVLGSVHRSIVGELSGLVAQRCCEIAAKRREKAEVFDIHKQCEHGNKMGYCEECEDWLNPDDGNDY